MPPCDPVVEQENDRITTKENMNELLRTDTDDGVDAKQIQF